MRPHRSTKIVATLGPATDSAETLERMLLAGVDTVRLNFSHGTHEEHEHHLALVRNAGKRLGRPVAVIQDLQGPKIRLGEVENGQVELSSGMRTTLVPDHGQKGTAESLPFSYPSLARHATPGDLLLMKDGTVRLRVQDVDSDQVRLSVEAGGPVTDRTGVNIPGVNLDVDALTDKDLEDLAFGVDNETDFVALSFVRTAQDIQLLRRHLERLDSSARIIAKIEKREALEHIDEIIEEADAVMVARGDLGAEIPPEEVPRYQKEIIRRAVIRGRAVITATQMLESMTTSPTPTPKPQMWRTPFATARRP